MKLNEKLDYMHRNPVTRGLVQTEAAYPWSSYRHWSSGEAGRVQIESRWAAREREFAADPLIAVRLR